jgi:hypothetical protein
LEAQDGIIGKTDLMGLALESGLDHVLEPFVQQVGRDES